MSTDTDADRNSPSPPTRITLELAEDGETWIVWDEETGVTTQGESREHALEMLDEAVSLHLGEAGDPVTDDDLRELGIDPDDAPDTATTPDVPWFDDEE